MLFWILLIAAVIFTVWYGIEEYFSIGEWIGYSFLMLILVLLLFLVGFLLCGCCEHSYAETPQLISTTEIVALRDGSNVEGHIGGGIFCTSGMIDEEPVYTVLVKTDKGLQTKTYKANETYIQYTDDVPRVEKVKYEATGFIDDIFICNGAYDKIEYIIYIPTDSQVVSDYVIDLE